MFIILERFFFNYTYKVLIDFCFRHVIFGAIRVCHKWWDTECKIKDLSNIKMHHYRIVLFCIYRIYTQSRTTSRHYFIFHESKSYLFLPFLFLFHCKNILTCLHPLTMHILWTSVRKFYTWRPQKSPMESWKKTNEIDGLFVIFS